MGSRIQLKESGFLLTIGIKRESFTLVGIQNPSYPDKDWNLVRRIRNPRLGIQISKLSWIGLLGTKENQWAEKDYDASRRSWFTCTRRLRGLEMVRKNFKVLISIFAVFLRFSLFRMGVFVSENSTQNRNWCLK